MMVLIIIIKNMLKFLQKRHEQKIKRPLIKYQPSMVYGNSIQSPSQFHHPHSVLHQSSYLNPFLTYDSKITNNLKPLPHHPPRQSLNQHPIIQRRTFAEIQNQINSSISQSKNPQNPFAQQQQQNQQTKIRNSRSDNFKKNKGQFTQFIEKNHRYQSIGPLLGIERNSSRIQQTKKYMWDNSSSTRIRHKRKQLSTNSRVCLPQNVYLMCEKNKIKRKRQKQYRIFCQSLQTKDRDSIQKFKIEKDVLKTLIFSQYYESIKDDWNNKSK